MRLNYISRGISKSQALENYIDRRKGKDNIMAGTKFILDGLVVVDGKKELGWKSEKHSKGWKDICPECQEG